MTEEPETPIIPITRARKKLSVVVPNDPRPTIRLVKGEIERIVDDSEAALIKANRRGLYQQANRIVSVVETPKKAAHGKDVLALAICERGDHALLEDLSVAANFIRFDRRVNDWVCADPPIEIVKTLKQRLGRLKLPILSGVISAPTLRADGSILSAPGYDEDTGLLFDPRGVTFPEIPSLPTRDDAARSLAALTGLIKDFPFEEPHDRSVALSGILTACCRPSLPAAPLHAYDATEPGTGKSKLVDVVSVIAQGHEAPVMAQGATEEELEKRLGATMLAGDLVVTIDNVKRPLEGDFLCQILTQSAIRTRILGESKTPQFGNAAFFAATGNSLVVKGDLVRRTVRCRINAKMERPEERVFDFDPVVEAKARRSELVAAALTILRSYHISGRPGRPDRLGSFEGWSDLVRGALIWLGEADPVLSMAALRKNDPEREELRAVIAHWRSVIGEERVTTSDVIGRATEMTGGRFDDDTLAYPEFRNALLAVGGKGGSLDVRVLGKWLQSQQDRVIDDGSIVKMGSRKDVSLWAFRTNCYGK